jgi:two-component system, sensor histidine kinase and response regulator
MSERAQASILVVDDTIENLQLLATMLEGQGYEVRPVTSGRQALRAAIAAPPEIVLLDLSMPEMDGYEVCRRFKENEALREIPVLFLTAFGQTADKIRAFEAGGADYITKPFQIDEVLARVRVHLALRQSHAELKASYARLQSLEKLRDDLVQMVIHDMRSPLTALSMLLTCLQEEVGDALGEQTREDLENAMSAAASVNRMANDVLDVSRLEEGKLPLDRARHDLVQICNEVVANRTSLDRRRAIEIEAPGAVEVVCDRDLVYRVVENLVGNALKHTPVDAQVRIAAKRDGDRAQIAVRDRGPGVPPDARARIFEKFGRVEGGVHTSHSAGLGLAFCKLAVEAHGGRIGVDDAAPGSVFWIELPG